VFLADSLPTDQTQTLFFIVTTQRLGPFTLAYPRTKLIRSTVHRYACNWNIVTLHGDGTASWDLLSTVPCNACKKVSYEFEKNECKTRVFTSLIGTAHRTSDALRDDLSRAVSAAKGNDVGRRSVMIWPFRNFSILLYFDVVLRLMPREGSVIFVTESSNHVNISITIERAPIRERSR